MTRTVVVAVMLLSLMPDGWSQTATYPVKLLRIVNPVAPGGNQDIVARAYAEQFSRNLGQQFVVESRPGNSAIVGTRFVKAAPADGYTLNADVEYLRENSGDDGGCRL
jgi:tripartite-type tricarboxylate transporter receptor subunit TctC